MDPLNNSVAYDFTTLYHSEVGLLDSVKLNEALKDFKNDPIEGKNRLNNLLVFVCKEAYTEELNYLNSYFIGTNEVIKAIVEAGADVNFQNKDGDTALHLVDMLANMDKGLASVEISF